MIGTYPGDGPELIDGVWLKGIAGGSNRRHESGLTALAGGSQIGATVIPARVEIVEFDTVATAADSCMLPIASEPGTLICVLNATANALAVFPNTTNNHVTNALDTLNGSSTTAYSVVGQSLAWFACAKAGVWIGNS